MKEYIWPKISFIVCFIMLAFGRYFVPITLRGLVDKKFWAISLEKRAETQRNALPFGSSMAELQRFGCQDTWPCSCKQTTSLRFPIKLRIHGESKQIVPIPRTIFRNQLFSCAKGHVILSFWHLTALPELTTYIFVPFPWGFPSWYDPLWRSPFLNTVTPIRMKFWDCEYFLSQSSFLKERPTLYVISFLMPCHFQALLVL